MSGKRYVLPHPSTLELHMQASHVTLKVRAHDSTIKKGLWEKRHPWEKSSRKPLLTKKSLHLPKEHADNTQDLWENILWIDERKAELLGMFEYLYI